MKIALELKNRNHNAWKTLLGTFVTFVVFKDLLGAHCNSASGASLNFLYHYITRCMTLWLIPGAIVPSCRCCHDDMVHGTMLPSYRARFVNITLVPQGKAWLHYCMVSCTIVSFLVFLSVSQCLCPSGPWPMFSMCHVPFTMDSMAPGADHNPWNHELMSCCQAFIIPLHP